MLAARRGEAAVEATSQLIEEHGETLMLLLLLGKGHQQQGRFNEMLRATKRALVLDNQHLGAQLQLAESFIFCGQHKAASRLLRDLKKNALGDPNLLQHIGQFFVHNNQHTLAKRCYQESSRLAPDNPQYLYNLATAEISTGEIAAAEDHLTSVIAKIPEDFDAWHSRSTLSKQTKEDNHIVALEKLLRKNPKGEVPLSYALAKEYEDIGEHKISFRYLKRGADSRRQKMAYQVEHDIQTMDQIAQLFGNRYAEDIEPAKNVQGPVFVLGLPRSGTTLVERIISSHTDVVGLGEINDFALSLMRVAGTGTKQDLLQKAAHLNMEKLGEAYLSSVDSYDHANAYFVDKTPANYLYVGLLVKALPGAKIIHLNRHPVDSCLAMYRTLFRMGYPFSYDLDDLARYYIGYHRLMQHWREIFPQSFLDVSYENLVGSQETVSREMIQWCGLEWQTACLNFEVNEAPVATASAVQVRQPIYTDAIARWRRYEKELTPLLVQLESGGIEI